MHLAGGIDGQPLQLPGRALRVRIEGPDRFQRVAEEIEPDRLRGARREEVDDAAAHRVFAGLHAPCREREKPFSWRKPRNPSIGDALPGARQ